MTPDYSINQTHFLFNTRAYKSYCQLKDIELHELLQKVQRTLVNGDVPDDLKGIKPFNTNDIPDILLAGHQSWCLYNKLPFDATELDADLWVDQLGGFVSGASKMTEVYTVFFSRLLNIDSEAVKVTQEEEKKS